MSGKNAQPLVTRVKCLYLVGAGDMLRRAWHGACAPSYLF